MMANALRQFQISEAGTSFAQRLFRMRHSRSSILNLRFRRAFSFAEVMFAVVILGIGFIMVAAIFPVAIQQTQATSVESVAASVARQAAADAGQLPGSTLNPRYNVLARPNEPLSLTLFPPTVKMSSLPASGSMPSVVEPMAGARWDAIRRSLILPSDARIAYVPFYRRDNNSPVAQLTIVAVQSQNSSTYVATNDADYAAQNPSASSIPGLSPAPNFPPSTISSSSPPGNVYPQTMKIAGGVPLARPGDSISVTYTVSSAPPVYETRIYRLGRLLSTGIRSFELEPPDDLRRSPGPITGTPVSDGLWGTWDDITDQSSALPIYKSSILYNATLQPVMAYARLSWPINSDTIFGRITLYDSVPSGGALISPNVAAEGAYVIVADDYPYDSSTFNPAVPTAAGANYAENPATPLSLAGAGYTPGIAYIGRSNGKIYHLGAAVEGSPGTYELAPDTPMQHPMGGLPSTDQLPAFHAELSPPTGAPSAPASQGPLAKVYIVGRSHSDPTVANSPYAGPSQAIAAYTTFFPVSN